MIYEQIAIALLIVGLLFMSLYFKKDLNKYIDALLKLLKTEKKNNKKGK